MPVSRSSAAREASEERKAEIMRLRREGHSFAAIGEKFGISTPRVHQIWRKALSDIPVPEIEALRAESAERLDDVLSRAYAVLADLNPLVQMGKELPYKDQQLLLATLKEIRQTEAQRARLFGLDAPVKTEVSGTQNVRYEVVGVDLEALS